MSVSLVCENCGSGVFTCHNCGAPGSAALDSLTAALERAKKEKREWKDACEEAEKVQDAAEARAQKAEADAAAHEAADESARRRLAKAQAVVEAARRVYGHVEETFPSGVAVDPVFRELTAALTAVDEPPTEEGT